MDSIDEKTFNRWKRIWGGILLCAWGLILWFLIRNGGRLSVEQILNFKPESTAAAVAAMTGLFALKSVDFIMHSGILYAANGIMFPLGWAIVFNLFGSALVMTTPYLIGKTLGKPLMAILEKKTPKLKTVNALSLESDFLVAFLFRISGLPLSILSLYFGAMGLRFGRYLAGSVLGFLPLLLNYTVLGMAASDVTSPVFLIAVGVKAAFFVGSMLVYRRLLKKSLEKKAGESGS